MKKKCKCKWVFSTSYWVEDNNHLAASCSTFAISDYVKSNYQCFYMPGIRINL